MLARTQLAALDHDHNTGQKQATKEHRNAVQSCLPKAKKDWIAKPIYEAKSYGYLQEMMAAVIQIREQNPSFERKHKSRPPPTSIAQNIALHQRPPKSKVVQDYKRRF